ncbi:MAG: ATP-binding protein [Bryobacteraceae bacterium]
MASQVSSYMDLAPHSTNPQSVAISSSALSRLLERSARYSAVVSEILLTDSRNRIVASSAYRERIGQSAPSRPSFSNARERQSWAKLFQLLRSGDDYIISSPAGANLRTQVVISSALLRANLLPALRQLLVVALVSILLAGLLGIVISDMVAGSLERIGRDIERISTGESKEIEGQFESAELSSLQVKLSLLGKQYHGARDDAANLRTNIDQMIQRLEEAVLLFDVEGCLQTAGPAAERLLGKCRDELIGKYIDDVFPAWTQLGAAVHSAVSLRTSVFGRPVQYARNNMSDTRLLLRVEAVDGSDGKPLGTLVTLRDGEISQQLQSDLDVSGRIASIHRLTSGVAHEIKNPLNGITLHLDLARSKVGQDQPQLAGELDIAAKELLRLDRVVKTFLNFNRPVDLQMTECNLVEIVREVLAQTGMLPGAGKISFSFASNLQNPVVLADRVLSKQAILNVLTNALESMPEGGEVRVGIEDRFDEFDVTVADSGAGIPAEIGDRIYNLYFTTKPDGKGVGLAESFMVMQLHSGSISFDSDPATGTTFHLRFPSKTPPSV